MDLTGLLLRAGAARPHVLIAAMPGGTQVRLAAEEQLRRRGWPAALTPADADVLLVAGKPDDGVADAVEAAWAAVAAPRARAQAAHAGEIAAALDAARAELGDRARQRRLAAPGAGLRARQPVSNRNGSNGGHANHPGHGDPGGHGEHGGHEGHGGHGMEMEMPGGLPMAERGEDRDGLKLDRLHVPLGPVLADWPTGLVVRLTLQGDVVQNAEAEAAGQGAGGGSFWTEPWRRAASGEAVTTGEAARRRAAAHLDSLGRFLAVAGWDFAAMDARGLRDAALSGVPRSSLGPGIRRLAARVAGSRVLAWSTRGIGRLRADGAEAGGAGSAALIGARDVAGDVTARYRRWCSDLTWLAAMLDDGSGLDSGGLEQSRGPLDAAQSAARLALLPGLLEGAEFAAARLIVASLDPDLDELPERAGTGRGG